jgi:hypothetical protein
MAVTRSKRMDEEEKMDLEREDPKPDMEWVPKGTFVAMGKKDEEIQKLKDQLYLANDTIQKTKSLLLDISKAALQMV